MSSISKKYKIAYVEVLEIIKNMPKELSKKIPQSTIEILTENMDTTYKFNYNDKFLPEEQQISKEAKATLVYLYQRYIKAEK